LFEITIPSKLYEYMAARKPVLCSVAGDAAELVTKSGCGVAVPPSDAGALALAVRRLQTNSKQAEAMGAAGKTCARRLFSRDSLMETYGDVIADVCVEAAFHRPGAPDSLTTPMQDSRFRIPNP